MEHTAEGLGPAPFNLINNVHCAAHPFTCVNLKGLNITGIDWHLLLSGWVTCAFLAVMAHA